MNLKKTILGCVFVVASVPGFSASLIKDAKTAGEKFLNNKTPISSVLPNKSGFPGNSCIENCYATYDRCIDDVGSVPGGSYWCSYNNLMCIDDCEGVGGF